MLECKCRPRNIEEKNTVLSMTNKFSRNHIITGNRNAYAYVHLHVYVHVHLHVLCKCTCIHIQNGYVTITYNYIHYICTYL